MNNELRYYKGKIKVRKLTKGDPTKKCGYRALETGLGLIEGNFYAIPWRLCHRRPKE